MRPKLRPIPLLLVLLTLGLPSQSHALDARYSPLSIDIADLSPGGEAVFFHASRQSEGLIPSVGVQRGVWVDTDQDGVISQELGVEAPRKALIVAIDLETGAFAVAAREESLISRIELPADALITGSNGELSAFRHAQDRLEMVVVRPGRGAWKISAGDGGPADLDPSKPGVEPVHDGTVFFSLSQMEPVSGSAQAEPPAALVPGDVLVMIDPRSLDHYAVTYEG